jgi:hypothetical protein
LLHKQAGPLTGETGSVTAGNRKVLAWRAPGDYIDRGQFRAFEFCNIPDMEHIREAYLSHGHGERLNLTRPYGLYAVPNSRQGESADAIE